MKTLKRLSLVTLTLVVALFVIGALFLNLSPQFGGNPTASQQKIYEATGHYKDGKFFNLEPFELKVDCHGIMAMLKKMFNPPVGLRPSRNIEVQRIDPISVSRKEARVTWLGHSSFLIRLDGVNILLDPVFSQFAAPHPWLGQQRYSKEMPIKINKAPITIACMTRELLLAITSRLSCSVSD